MKKSILYTALLAGTLSFHEADAQLALKKGITLEELVKEINVLAQKGDDASKVQMKKEAQYMADSKNETFALMAVGVYNHLQQKEEADKTKALILKRFPKGIQARKDAFESFYGDESLSTAQLEEKYINWEKKFPKSYFEKMNIDKDFGFSIVTYYAQAAQKMARRFIKAGEYDKIGSYLDKEDNIDLIPIAQDLVNLRQYDRALPIVSSAYERNSQALETAKKENKSMQMAERNFNSSAALYAEVLLETGNSNEAVKIARRLADQGYSSPGNTAVLAKGLSRQGQDLNAFLTLEKFMVKNGKNDGILKEIEPLYNKLNNNKGDFNTYISAIEAQIKDALVSKYKGEMIKKEAPNFSLVNRDGQTVSLADLKGKVIVLDFWATWCGPCKISFPGMQAAVNKYKDDKEVEFLFIDTWQREENYKELVNEFITKNNYTFHVLFDEMNDRSQATVTAYGVQGIPHKVVIDKEGFIRFESSGGSADVEKIVHEMETKIELARKG